jgi:8-oxo-dGTP pyrophosphatase MutT (NUDIX family)
MKEQDLQRFISYLQKRLGGSLPGRLAHERMIPLIRLNEFPEYPEKGVKAGVLLLIYPVRDSLFTCLILRTVYKGVHSGQISLPGGKYMEIDGDLMHTALREAKEEVNIDPGKAKMIGKLSDLFIPPSGFILTPYLAYADERPAFQRELKEVDEIIEVDIRDISDKNLREKEITLHNGRVLHTPYYDLQGHVVWGATGMILAEFAELTRDYIWP